MRFRINEYYLRTFPFARGMVRDLERLNDLCAPWKPEETAVDIDGVLCRDPTNQELDAQDEGQLWHSFLGNAIPFLMPEQTVGAVVTNRLERHRDRTEQWLFENGIAYRQLHMSPHPSREERHKNLDYGPQKARAILDKDSPLKLFVESDPRIAPEIAHLTHKPVICAKNLHIYWRGKSQQITFSLSWEVVEKENGDKVIVRKKA
jgi:orotate phosphoribosyltransferase